MPKRAEGELRLTADGWVARITLKGRERLSLLLSSCKTEESAKTRCLFLADLAARFRRAGKLGDPDARKLLEMAAVSAEALLPGVLTVADQVCGGEL